MDLLWSDNCCASVLTLRERVAASHRPQAVAGVVEEYRSASNFEKRVSVQSDMRRSHSEHRALNDMSDWNRPLVILPLDWKV